MTSEEQRNVHIYTLLSAAQNIINRALIAMWDGGRGNVDQDIWDAHQKCYEAILKYSKKMAEHMKVEDNG